MKSLIANTVITSTAWRFALIYLHLFILTSAYYPDIIIPANVEDLGSSIDALLAALRTFSFYNIRAFTDASSLFAFGTSQIPDTTCTIVTAAQKTV